RLEAGVPLVLEHVNLVLQLRERLAVAVVRAGDVAGHGVPVAAEEAVQRQLRDLADDVPERDVHGRRDADDRLARPLLLVRQPLPGQREELLVEGFGRERVGTDDLVRDPGLHRVNRRLDRRVARRDADPLDALVGLHADQDLVRLGDAEVGDRVRAYGGGRAENVNLEGNDFHASGECTRKQDFGRRNRWRLSALWRLRVAVADLIL